MAAVSGICYWGYYTCLGRAYSSGALSVAYPISRGVAPSAAALAGTLVLGERLGALGWAGVVLVSCGIFLVGRADTAAGASRLDRRTVLWAVATGLFSAGYMVSDKVGVQRADPCLYLSLSFLLGGARGQPRENPEAKVGLALSAAASCTVAYLAVLWVMRSEPVAAVAPVRSLAVVLSVFVGSRLLGEEAGPVRYFGAGTILTGIVLVSIG